MVIFKLKNIITCIDLVRAKASALFKHQTYDDQKQGT